MVSTLPETAFEGDLVGQRTGLGRRLTSELWRGITPLDLVFVASIALLVFFVNDVGYMLRHPFWLDEAWVADAAKARIGLTPKLAFSTPLGWTFLLRLVPFGGVQRLRLVPLAFTVLAAVTGYLFGRELRLGRYSTGILTGLAVLVSPAMLARQDLKPYTAEAFGAILIITLVARIENRWTIPRLASIAVVSSVGFLFANSIIFVGAAAMFGLAIESIVRRRYDNLLKVVVASLAMFAVAGGIYLGLVAPHVTTNLTNYWSPYFLPSSPGAATHAMYEGFLGLAPYMGFRALAVDVVLVLAGIGALLWMRRIAIAVVLPVTLLLVLGASARRHYPFGDLRTSTFWLVMVPVMMAVGVAAGARWIAALDRRLAVAAVILTGAVWIGATDTYMRSHTLGDEDVRSQVYYLESHLQPGDSVIVDYAASYGFAYYFSGTPTYVKDPVAPTGFIPTYPSSPFIISMRDREAADVSEALSRAETVTSTGRIWIVTSHLNMAPNEVNALELDLSPSQLTVFRVGPEPLVLYHVPTR